MEFTVQTLLFPARKKSLDINTIYMNIFHLKKGYKIEQQSKS